MMMMKRRQRNCLLQWFVFLVLVLAAARASRGGFSHLLHQFSKRSELHPISRVLLSLATPNSANHEARVSEESLISPSFPPHESPIGVAPDSRTVPEGSLRNPPTMSTRDEVLTPAAHGSFPPVWPSIPPNRFAPVSRSLPPILPATPIWPVEGRAGAPEAVLHAQPPNNSSSVTVPNAQGPVAPHAGESSHESSTPTASPPKESSLHLSPTVQKHLKGFAVSPSSLNTPVANATRNSEPVRAPQNNFASLSPHNELHSKGSNSSLTPLANPPSTDKGQAIVPVAASPGEVFNHSRNHSHVNGSAVSPIISTPPSSGETTGIPAAAPPNELTGSLVSPTPDVAPKINYRHGALAPAPSTRDYVHLSPENNPARAKVSSPAISPMPSEAATPSNPTISSPSYSQPTPGKVSHGPSPAPAVIFYLGPTRSKGPAYAPFPQPAISPRNSQKHPPPVTYAPGPSTPHHDESQGAPSPSPDTRTIYNNRGHTPVFPPSASISDHQRAPKLQPIHALPPPPPNQDCPPISCPAPFTISAPGSPCACVLPINVGLRLSISLYTFFPLVSKLAKEIASGVLMEQRQVRIMGANADSQSIDGTIVLIDLVPRGDNFDYNTTTMVYQKFWHKQVYIDPSSFGDYTVLYVRYPGLPPSPPAAPGNINPGESNANPRAVRPLAVDVRHQKGKQSAVLIAIVVLSAVIAVVLCLGCVWFFVLNYRRHSQTPTSTRKTSQPPLTGTGPALSGSRHGSESTSFASSIAPYTGSTKTFSLAEMERATNSFSESRTIGEGGFGRVYEGTLDDGTRVAIKVLKRDDRQGGREFLAEVEMLGRLHHRNLIKLIGICTEAHIRCLVYELLPNGSVESHLHGADKETAPLDWNARLKIALGAARALAYLHEDSSPRVIHRDFKSSNILLEEDFTPKVSDFGLARAALGEGHEYISTRVMGTFGYVAPEYAMTGHLLVKSDVYSYGVVLLELLTGRKPVDMLRPPGQESLVTWARPYLTSKEGLEMIIDPSLGTNIPYDSVAKVAAIASMCVQPEVNQRPFMGEVVQALKLVCNDGDDYKVSELYSQENLPAHDKEISIGMGWESESEKVLSASDIFNMSAGFTKDVSGSFRQYSSSGPLRPGSKEILSQTAHSLSTGSMSDHGKFGKGLDNSKEWP